jgi:hypothetical protein
VGTLTNEQHETDRALAQELIERGRVATWLQLGTAFGISGQAAHARFGPKGYGLVIPKRARKTRRVVSVSLGPKLDGELEALRQRWTGEDPPPTRAGLARLILEKELARYAGNPEVLAGQSMQPSQLTQPV